MKNLRMNSKIGEKLRFLSVVLRVLFLVLSVQSLGAQVASSISGRVDDATGSAVAGAAITVKNVETGSSRTMVTDESGDYRALALPVGHYEVQGEKTGFQVQIRRGIDLVVGQEAIVNLVLSVGEVTQEVTVTGEAPLVNTTTASISGLVGEQQVKDLPLNGRSYDNLITLNTGAVNYSAMKTTAGSGTGSGNYFSVQGRYPNENLFLLNGVEYTSMSQVGVTPGGASGQLLGIDAVREFNVVSGTYDVQYGKRAGAQVSIVTQSGTNQFHGSIFEFLRNSALDARNFFDQDTVPPFKRNQFGGSAGGPIRKDKTFIFGNYEGFRSRLGLSGVSFVPDANARQGILPCGAITPLPSGCAGTTDKTPKPVPNVNAGIFPYMAYWPVANGPVLGGGIAQNFANPVQTIQEDFGTMRVDHNFSDHDTLSGVYTIDDGFNQTPLQNPVFATAFTLREQVASLQETHIFSPHVTNSFTAGFSRGGFVYGGKTLTSFPSNLAFVQGAPAGIITIGGSSSGGGGAGAATISSGGSNSVFHFYRNLFTYGDGVQIVKGKHQISAGAWFQRIQVNELGSTRGNGNAVFSTLQTFLQGITSSFNVAPNTAPLYWRSLEGAWYLQDVIQLRRNLTLRLGVRHEFTTGWNEAHNHAANYAYDSNGILITNTVVGSSVFSENKAKWLFGPRVGLAWDVFGNGKTSLRSGFGLHYDLLDNIGFEFESVPPFTGAISFSNVPILPLLPLTPGAPLAPVCGVGVPTPCTTYQPQGVQRNVDTPTVESWNLTIEQQITANMSLSVAYVGSRGYHEIVSLDSNAIRTQICANAAGCISGGTLSNTPANRGLVPQGAEYIPTGLNGVPNTRLNPFLTNATIWSSLGKTSFNALQVQMTRRLSQGLQFRANYTWAKFLDTGSGRSPSQSGNQAGNIAQPYNPERDWGPAAEDIKHQATANFSYELPIGRNKTWLRDASGVADKLASGWQVNGIVTLLTGFPFTPLAGSNRSGNGDSKNPDRVSVNPAFTGQVITGSPNQWYNPNAFLFPTAGTYGNATRGSLRGPGLSELDFSVFKNTRLSERIGTEFRAEFFNIFNHSNFSFPNANVFAGAAVSPTAGIISSTATTSRQIQFGLKVSF